MSMTKIEGAAQLRAYINDLTDSVERARPTRHRTDAGAVWLWGGVLMLACVALFLTLFLTLPLILTN